MDGSLNVFQWHAGICASQRNDADVGIVGVRGYKSSHARATSRYPAQLHQRPSPLSVPPRPIGKGHSTSLTPTGVLQPSGGTLRPVQAVGSRPTRLDHSSSSVKTGHIVGVLQRPSGSQFLLYCFLQPPKFLPFLRCQFDSHRRYGIGNRLSFCSPRRFTGPVAPLKPRNVQRIPKRPLRKPLLSLHNRRSGLQLALQSRFGSLQLLVGGLQFQFRGQQLLFQLGQPTLHSSTLYSQSRHGDTFGLRLCSHLDLLLQLSHPAASRWQPMRCIDRRRVHGVPLRYPCFPCRYTLLRPCPPLHAGPSRVNELFLACRYTLLQRSTLCRNLSTPLPLLRQTNHRLPTRTLLGRRLTPKGPSLCCSLFHLNRQPLNPTMRLVPTTQTGFGLEPRISVGRNGSRYQVASAGITANNTRQDPPLFITLEKRRPVSLRPISGFSHRQPPGRTLRPSWPTRSPRLRKVLRNLHPPEGTRTRLYNTRLVQPCLIRQPLIRPTRTTLLPVRNLSPRTGLLISTEAVQIRPHTSGQRTLEIIKVLPRNTQPLDYCIHFLAVCLQHGVGSSLTRTARRAAPRRLNRLLYSRACCAQFPTDSALYPPAALLRAVQRIVKAGTPFRPDQTLQLGLQLRLGAGQTNQILLSLIHKGVTPDPRLARRLVQRHVQRPLCFLRSSNKNTLQPGNPTPTRQFIQPLHSSIVKFPSLPVRHHVSVVLDLPFCCLLGAATNRIQRCRNLSSKQVGVIPHNLYMGFAYSLDLGGSVLDELQPCRRLAIRQHQLVATFLNLLVRLGSRLAGNPPQLIKL